MKPDSLTVAFQGCCVEAVEATRAAHDDDALVCRGTGCSVGELVALHAILYIKLGDALLGSIQLVQTTGCTYPYSALIVFDEARDTVLAQSVFGGVMLQEFTPPFVYVGSIFGAIPNVAFAVYKDAVGEAVAVQAVHAAQCGGPAVVLDVVASQSDGGGKV